MPLIDEETLHEGDGPKLSGDEYARRLASLQPRQQAQATGGAAPKVMESEKD